MLFLHGHRGMHLNSNTLDAAAIVIKGSSVACPQKRMVSAGEAESGTSMSIDEVEETCLSVANVCRASCGTVPKALGVEARTRRTRRTPSAEWNAMYRLVHCSSVTC